MGQFPIHASNTPAQGTKAQAGITTATVAKVGGGRVMSLNVNVTSTSTTVPAVSIYDRWTSISP
jgi:hypothetical protein